MDRLTKSERYNGRRGRPSRRSAEERLRSTSPNTQRRTDPDTPPSVRLVTGEPPQAEAPSKPWTWTWDRLLVEPRRPTAIREHPEAHWFAVAAVCVGAFMGQLDASIVTVALPTLQHTFNASVGAVTWVGLSYLLVLVATVTTVGRFADMWGRSCSTCTASSSS